MSSTHRSHLRTVVAATLCLTSLAGFSQSALAAAAEKALSATQHASDVELPALAQPGTGVLGALNSKAANAPQISFTLPDGRTIMAFRQRTEENTARGAKTWVGRFLEEPGSIASLTTYKGVTTGTISYGTETWELIPAKGGRHLLYRVDDAKLPTAEPEVLQQPGDLELLASGGTTSTSTATTATTGGVVQDLLVVYTPAAAAKHGQATLETMIQNAVAMANQAYQNSDIGITLNLVGLQQIDYVESGDIQTSLNEIRSTTDGKIDSIHTLRDSLGADLVSMISTDSNACGIAGVMTTVSTSSSYMGFERGEVDVPQPALAGARDRPQPGQQARSRQRHYAGSVSILVRLPPLHERRHRLPHGDGVLVHRREPRGVVLEPGCDLQRLRHRHRLRDGSCELGGQRAFDEQHRGDGRCVPHQQDVDSAGLDRADGPLRHGGVRDGLQQRDVAVDGQFVR